MWCWLNTVPFFPLKHSVAFYFGYSLHAKGVLNLKNNKTMQLNWLTENSISVWACHSASVRPFLPNTLTSKCHLQHGELSCLNCRNQSPLWGILLSDFLSHLLFLQLIQWIKSIFCMQTLICILWLLKFNSYLVNTQSLQLLQTTTVAIHQ